MLFRSGVPELRDRPPVNGSRLWQQLIKSRWAPGSGLILIARKPSAYRPHPVPSRRDGGQTLLCLWWPRPDLRWLTPLGTTVAWSPPGSWGKGLVGRAPRGAGRCSALGPPRASDPARPALHLVLRAGSARLSSPVVHGVTGHFSSCVWYLRGSPDTRIRALHRVRVTATRLSDAIPVDPSAPPLWTQ